MSTLGYNTGIIEDYYKQYLDNPDSVSPSWREFFAGYSPDASVATPAQRAATAPATPAPAAPVATAAAAPVPATANGTAAAAPATASPSAPAATVAKAPAAPAGGDGAAAPPDDGATRTAIRGASSKIVENMEASLTVPTATSVRTFPVKLMSENRRLINDHQKLVGGVKVSFTHLIAHAVALALKHQPAVNAVYEDNGGTPTLVMPAHVNLGLAIDLEKRGKRTLVVPSVKGAEALTFAQFLAAYNDIVRRARDGALTLDDFAGTTASITNPGMIGTTLSVPRLMPGQAVIVGVGSIGYPPEFFAMPPDAASRAGYSEVMTLTSTYDHRVIQGAESGAFLAHLVELLLGQHGFYESVFQSLGIVYPPFRHALDSAPAVAGAWAAADEQRAFVQKQARVLQLIRAFRVRGHLQADVNPLGYEWRAHDELDIAHYGLSVWDLDRVFLTGGLGGKEEMPLREILDVLRETYTRKVGVEYMHITSVEEKRWLIERVEGTRVATPLAVDEKKRILDRLNAAEAFETFLHTKYVGQKRFSLQGADATIPFLDAALTAAAEAGVREAVMGMAHRGRLNVLANVLGKSFEAIFGEFEGHIDPETMHGSGDVKYHLGMTGTHHAPGGQTVALMLAANPSHLETVDPIVEGMARARQDVLRENGSPDDPAQDAVLPILLHGDAAFAGQGVVPETLNMSQLRGYRTGGTIHLVVNNQIGFTTVPADSRSTTYATDVARMIQAPIFHVNADDPEAVVRVARLAFAYRQAFNKDVVVDLICYRVYGHNEGDEPTYTNPILYRKIQGRRSPRLVYVERLVRRGDLTPADAEQMLDDFRGRLTEAFDKTRDDPARDTAADARRAAEALAGRADSPLDAASTAVPRAALDAVTRALMTAPEDFHVHPKLAKQFGRRAELFEAGKIDWGYGEALAFGTLLLDGTPVRVTGQDSRRGTFSHRHAVLYDQETGAEYAPLAHIAPAGGDGAAAQGPFMIYDSLLSEYAVCAFEYGYSVARPEALVVWEAQFGDFANGAQIVFDQFLASAEAKWAQQSSLVLLLPHGYEGQGPEHSSARLERFLQLCAEDNLIVANLTTPANFFHALRRQVTAKKPLVVMSPKSLLRLPAAVSAPADFTDGAFQPVIPATAQTADRHVFCSGKVYYDLVAEAPEGVAVTRVEQLYPWPDAEVRAEIERIGASTVVWAQEEPRNMGAWTFVREYLETTLDAMRGGCHRIEYAGRRASASPAVGSARISAAEQAALVAAALGVAG